MGKSMANEILLLCRRITVNEAYCFNLVSRIVKKNEDAENIIGQISTKLAQMPSDCLIDAKRLINNEKEQLALKEINRRECENLARKWSSPDLMQHLMKFFQGRKPNL